MNLFKDILRINLLILVVFASTILAYANATYSSQRVERLARVIKIAEINRDNVSYTKYGNLPIIIETAGDTINHIGIDIFGSELKETNPIIYRFIEQYLLEVISLSGDRGGLNNIYGDGISIDGDLKSIPILKADDDKISLSISQYKGSGYKVNWSDGIRSFSIMFPSNFELISGNNKIGLENRFKHQVTSHKVKNKYKPAFATDTIRISDDIWVVKNGYYGIKEIENAIYLMPTGKSAGASHDSLTVDTMVVCEETQGVIPSTDTVDSRYTCLMAITPSGPNTSMQDNDTNNRIDSITTTPVETRNVNPAENVAPIIGDTIQHLQVENQLLQDSLVVVCDNQYPIETIHNLLSNSAIEGDIIVNVSLNKYGFKKETFECPLNQLIDYCLEQGCIPYVGIDANKEPKKITAYLLMVQSDYCYNHVFRFIFDADVLQNFSGKVSATLDVYVPTHNISTLYGEKTNQITNL